MILVIGGTTEGRLAAAVADSAGTPFFYSTRGELQQLACHNGIHITGPMDAEAMSDFCQENDIRLIVDAAHPFAVGVHSNVEACSKRLQLPVIRLERVFPEHSSDIIWCSSYEEACSRMLSDGVCKLLALTGVQTIGKLRSFWNAPSTECRFRILQREESLSIARREGFPESNLLFYGDLAKGLSSLQDEISLLSSLRPDAIITKESGQSGGFMEKVEAAHRLGIRVYAVMRPPLPSSFVTVTGEHGLRRQIERLAPGFFPLRSGFTTGTCATAASKAALLALLGRQPGDSLSITFPDGEEIELPIAPGSVVVAQDGNSATAAVVKDAGDDPDVTDGIVVESNVAFRDESVKDESAVRFFAGEGVGRVTLPGLGLEIGSPAINRVPRQMIIHELSSLCSRPLDVTISVPGGREIAKRTFNPRIGIVDGISIIGTSGIVRPFSSQAFVDAIRREIEVCVALGCKHLVINSGARSENYIRALYPELPTQAFVHYGNFIGDTLNAARELGIEKLTMGLMIGKAVKLAEGQLDTHSHKVVMNKDFLCSLASASHCSQEALDIISSIKLARELWTSLSSTDLEIFVKAIKSSCLEVCRPLFPDMTIHLIDEDGKIF